MSAGKIFRRSSGPRDQKIVVVPVSFETGEQTGYFVFFPFKARILGIQGTVTKAIAATDNGTITGANSSGSSTAGVLTATASDALATAYTEVLPTTNNTVAAQSYYKLTTAKATAGGKVLVTLRYQYE